RLSARLRGGQIQIEVQDDGAGLDLDRVRRVVVQKGLLAEEQAAALGHEAAAELIFQPGLSTSANVSDVSGRGVGMDVVRTHVERLGGHVTVSSMPGGGTHFLIDVPLTLATVRAILVEDGDQVFAVPSAPIERTARLQGRQLASVEGRRTVRIDGSAVPVVSLADVVERPAGSAVADAPDVGRPFGVLGQ